MSTTLESPHNPSAVRSVGRRKSGAAYWIFLLCASLYLLPFMRVLIHGANEGTMIGRAVEIAHGQVFGRDFFELIGPGSFYGLAFFFKLFGVNFFATRICLFLVSLGTALLMYFLSRRICRGYQALPCVLLFATSFGLMWPEINPHTDSNFLALLAVTCMVLWLDSRKGGLAIAAGFLAGASTLCLLPKGVLLLGAIVAWLCVQRWRRKVALSSMWLVAAGYVAAIVSVAIYFWSHGALHDVIFNNILWPYRHYGAENSVPYAYGIFNFWTRWAVRIHGVRWLIPLGVVSMISVLFVAVLPILTPLLGIPHGKANFQPEILLYWFCGWAMWLAEIHRRDIGHLVSGSPLLLILCIYFLSEMRGKIVKFTLQPIALSIGALATMNLFLVMATHPVTTRVGTVAMFKDDPVLKFLDTHVAPGAPILAYPYCPMYYFLSATTNPTRFSAFVYGFTPPEMYREVIEDLDRKKVKYVVWDTNFETKQVRILFPSVPRTSPSDYILEPYLESHYSVVQDWEGVKMLERKPEVR